jgi:hypothetical protein
MLRAALVETRYAVIAATKAVCLEIAEDEAERCRSVGATAAQQTALTIVAGRGGWARPRRRVARRDPLHCDRGQK